MTAPTRRIDRALLDRVTGEAMRHPRLRMNFNFHRHEEPVQRFLNAIEPGSYIRPHCHRDPPNWEMFICLRGRGAVFVFDGDGTVTEAGVLDPADGTYGVEVPAGAWHTVISLEPGSVFLEIKEGPFEPKHAGVFAPWSPEPDDPAAAALMNRLARAVETGG